MNDEQSTPKFDVPEGYTVLSTARAEELERRSQELERVRIAIQNEEAAQNQYWSNHAPHVVIDNLFRHWKRETENAHHSAMSFRDQVIANFRALEIVINASLMGGTHAEKNARLRGVLDVIAYSIDEMRDLSDQWFSYRWWPQSLLRSDSSVPRAQRKVWELEHTIEAYQKHFGNLPVEENGREEDSNAF